MSLEVWWILAAMDFTIGLLVIIVVEIVLL